MSFRIQTQSPELKRELENRLAELQGQLDGDFDYEISAEVLSRERALETSQKLAQHSGADTIFVAAGAFVAKQSLGEISVNTAVEEDPDFAIGLAPVRDEQHATEDGGATHLNDGDLQRQKSEKQKFQQAIEKKSAQAREFSAGVAAWTSSFIAVAARSSSEALSRAGEWASTKGAEAQVAGSALRKRIAEKIQQSRERAAEWNARRSERQAAESKLRAQRERAAHREAELAAVAAHIMHREQKEKAERPAIRQKARIVQNATVTPVRERDTWPIWRNAFAAAACLAVIGIFLLAAGGKQTKASPATSTELNQPAVAVPEHLAPRPKPAAAAPNAAPPSAKVEKPSPRKRVAGEQADESFQEVTVRHYPNASPLAPPKKDAKGVVQISDME
jgi:hypothetical protein